MTTSDLSLLLATNGDIYNPWFCRWMFKLSEWASLSTYDVGLKEGANAAHILVLHLLSHPCNTPSRTLEAHLSVKCMHLAACRTSLFKHFVEC